MRSGRLLGGALAALVTIALGACGGVPHPATQDVGEARAATPAAGRWPDEARYALDVAYDPRRFALAGAERIAFRNVGPDTLTSVWVRAWANAFGGCAAHRARVAVTGSARAYCPRTPSSSPATWAPPNSWNTTAPSCVASSWRRAPMPATRP